MLCADRVPIVSTHSKMRRPKRVRPILGTTVSAPAAGAGAAQAALGERNVYVDRLLRAPAQTTGQSPSATPADQTAARAELLQIITPITFKGGEISTEDRNYAGRIVAARTGMQQADAEQRVNQTITQAKDAADKARRGAAKFSIWVAISLLAGAFSGSLAAAEGGKLRNAHWYEKQTSPNPTVVVRN